MPSKTCGFEAMISARRGADAMMVTMRERSGGFLPISEKSWMPAGSAFKKLSNRSSASSARRLSPKALSKAGIISVSRSRASTDCVAR
ncbi:hypothetical protein D3C87_1520430 [compost metagenome]